MSDALNAATNGMPGPKGQKHHPTAALGHDAVHAVSRFIQAARQLPGTDHGKIDQGIETLRRGLDEVLAGIKAESKAG